MTAQSDVTRQVGTQCADENCNCHLSHHPTVRVKWEEQEADIDEKIAPLILSIWKCGIYTLFSCQDYGETMPDANKMGWVELTFEIREFKRFMEVVKKPLSDFGIHSKHAQVYPWPFSQFEFNLMLQFLGGQTQLMVNVLIPPKWMKLLQIQLDAYYTEKVRSQDHH